MPVNTQDVLCRYHYDALDRLIGTTPASDDGLQRFYCKSRLVTEIQGVVQRSIFQQGEQLLAQQEQRGNLVEASLLATDQMRSVLQATKENRHRSIAYSPYGHRPTGNSSLNLLGFNGERSDPITGHYLLGNGYRVFSPALMRFNSPDNISPFGKGGLNPYAYCLGDPINRYDESGHFSLWKSFKSLFNFKKKPMFSFSPPATPTVSRKYMLYELQLDKDVSPAIIIDQYKAARSQGYTLKVPIVKISDSTNLNSLPYPRDLGRYKHKTLGGDDMSFVYTQHEELFVGSSGHLALSTAVRSPRVISAGEITRTGARDFRITNSSGHFKPSFDSLTPVKLRLEELGATVSVVRHQGPNF